METTKVEEVFQVIDAELNYVDDFENYLIKKRLVDFGADYRTISIIGPQSSGKSTLLNRVFETQFKEMDPRKGRQQTTQGVWISCATDQRIFIMDLEGSDSIERGDDRKTFEQTTALLALTFSDLLFVNMWEQDLGRAQGSSFEILKTIFEINLKLFAQESAKKIVFLVRDFDASFYGEDGLANIKRVTEERLEKMWDSLTKPEKFQNTSFKKFFYFRFETMPSIKDPAAFKARVEEIRQQLCEKESKNYILGGPNSNIPVDGLPLFLKNSWEKIRSDKDINLPSQKELISSLRCNEFKHEAIMRQEDTFKSLRGQCKRRYFDGFSKVASQMIHDSLEFYDGSARHYTKTVYEEVRNELIKEFHQKFFKIFQEQLILLDKQAYEIWEAKVKQMIKPESVSTNFQEAVGRIVTDIVDDFKKKALKLKITDAEWNIEDMVDNLIERLEKFALTLKENELQKLHDITRGKLQKELNFKVHEVIVDLDEEFWQKMKESYMSVVSSVITSVEGILIQGFQLQENDAKLRLIGVESEGYGILRKKVISECNDLNTIMREQFSKAFKLDQKGVSRDWKSMEEDRIKELFTMSKDKILNCLKQFRLFKIDPQEVTRDTKKTKDFTVDGGQSELLDQKQIDKIKSRFEEDVEMIFDQAMNKHYGRIGGRVPWYFWVITFFFGYEKIISYVYSPIILYPLVMVGGVFAMLHSLGLSGVVLSALRLTINRLFRRMNLNFHI